MFYSVKVFVPNTNLCKNILTYVCVLFVDNNVNKYFGQLENANTRTTEHATL